MKDDWSIIKMSTVSLSSFLCMSICLCPCVTWEITLDRVKAKIIRKLVGRAATEMISCVKECDYCDILQSTILI